MSEPRRSSSAVDEGQSEEAELLAPGLIHEMRQPLLGIKAGLQLLARSLGETLQSQPEWPMVNGQVERLEELFRTYQEFLHPELQRRTEFPLSAVVERATALLQHRLRRLGPRFQPAPTTGGAKAFGSPQAVLHAVTNVMANALDALDQTPGVPRLAVRIVAAPSHAQVRVSDEGPGVPDALREQIFEARFTTKETGSGLGLHIARRMLTAIGGSIRLVEKDDVLRLPWARTEFCIELLAEAPEEHR